MTQPCRLLGGSFAFGVQAALGLVALGSLVVKRHRERPQRPVRIWLFDVSKQALSASLAHVMNLLLAMLFAIENPSTDKDQCAWYFVNYLVDTTLGVVIAWALVRALERTATKYHWTSLQKSGDYGNPPTFRAWWKQLASWIGIIIISKAALAGLIILLETPLGALSGWMFGPLQPYPKTELVLVMIVCPCLMNIIQFWIFDNVLMKDKKKKDGSASDKSVSSDGPGDSERRSLLSAADNPLSLSADHLSPRPSPGRTSSDDMGVEVV